MEGNEMERTEGRRGPPDWMYRGRKPKDDDSYFENMSRVIFLAGFSWKVVGNKWPEFRKAFSDFSIDEVASFGENDVEALVANPKIIRNRAKIEATIENARRIKDIRGKFGSFEAYLNSLDKKDNYSVAVKDISKRFVRMGPSSSRIFLYSIGEDVHRPEEISR